MTDPFDYDLAFSRNLGWLTETEQRALARKKVAIAGMGGVGGVHLLTLARLGIGRFAIADFDLFDQGNFNRQAGASMSTVGRPKVEVLAAMARDINPEAEIEVFGEGVSADNVGAFLRQADVYVDGLDFFAFDARQTVFNTCARLGVPAVTAAPLGMGAAWLSFVPGGMDFEGYFGWDGCSELDKALRLLVGLSPAGVHRPYLVDPTRVDLAARRGPSTAIACQLCAGVAAAEALKLMLGRGQVRAAPHGLQFDAYRGRFVKTWRPGGHRNPLQRLLLTVARRQFGRILEHQEA